MRFHVRVTPTEDEPLVLTLADADAGYAWLEAGITAGWITECEAFVVTGGYMNIWLDAPGEEEGLQRIDALMIGYPLIKTITYTVDILAPTLADGFNTLREHIRDQKRIGA